MTRHQQRLAARYERALQSGTRDQIQQAQDDIIGDALYRRHQASLTPIDRALHQHGIYQTAKRMAASGVHFVDAYCAIFRTMPMLAHIEDRAE